MNGIIPMASAARFALTVYLNAYQTLPIGKFDQYAALSWQEVVDLVAGGDKPQIVSKKDYSKFLNSGLLSEGLLTISACAKYKQRFNIDTNIGRARCSNCCQGPSSLLFFDVDGAAGAQYRKCLQILDFVDTKFLVYSTHTNGSTNPEKLGYRYRIVLPVSRPVSATEYTSIHRAIRQDLLQTLGEKCDGSAEHLSQLQGTWATTQERAHKAFKRRRDHGGCLDVNYWLARAVELGVDVKPYTEKEYRPPVYRSPAELGVMARRVAKALEMIPSRTTHFQAVLIYVKAADLGDDGFELFNGWAWADREHQAKQQAQREAYNPEVAWARAKPSMPAEAGVGAICKLAKQCALDAINANPTFSNEATHDALSYLCANHQKDFTLLAQRFVPNMVQQSSGVAGYE